MMIRRNARVSLAAAAIVGALTSHAWAPPTSAVTPNIGNLTPNLGNLVPNVGALTPNVGALTPNAGALSPNAGALAPQTTINVPNANNLPGMSLDDFPSVPSGAATYTPAQMNAAAPRLNTGGAANAPPVQSNYVNLPQQQQLNPAPLANTPAVQSNYVNLPDMPATPQANAGGLLRAPVQSNYVNLPQGALPNNAAALPDRPLQYGTLPAETPSGVVIPGYTSAVSPAGRQAQQFGNVQNLPQPQALAGTAPPVPPKTFWQRHKTKFIVGGVIVVVAGAGLSVPIIIEKVTGEEIADTGIPEVDKIVDGLTGGDSASP